MAVVLLKMSMVVALLAVVAGILFSGNSVASGPVSGPPSKCKEGWLGKVIGECALYIKKGGPRITPSKRCCDGVKKACICGMLPPYFDKFFSVDKMLYVLRFCGKPLNPGVKCGNDKVPPPPPPEA